MEQKPGDLIVTNPGTYHQVEGQGRSIQYAYNICKANLEQIKYSQKRYNMVMKALSRNKFLLKRTSLVRYVPFKHTLLHYLMNFKNCSIKKEILKLLFRWIAEEKKKLAKKQSQRSINMRAPVENNFFFCEICGEEFILYYSLIKIFDNVSSNQPVCLKCLPDMVSVVYKKQTDWILEHLRETENKNEKIEI